MFGAFPDKISLQWYVSCVGGDGTKAEEGRSECDEQACKPSLLQGRCVIAR